ncbi:hypothetical protein EZS27_002504 [termite gut metagenome]|uniref:Uncharacterized protein n=1 Tax=termite gut metagenome TaxID=433724 RepID=A0A5J4SXE8_9ZZZZ
MKYNKAGIKLTAYETNRFIRHPISAHLKKIGSENSCFYEEYLEIFA